VLLVTDGHKVYRAFTREAGITHEAVKLQAGVRICHAVHTQNVNAYHSCLCVRRFCRIYDVVAQVG
jgi:hypothetical protein